MPSRACVSRHGESPSARHFEICGGDPHLRFVKTRRYSRVKSLGVIEWPDGARMIVSDIGGQVQLSETTETSVTAAVNLLIQCTSQRIGDVTNHHYIAR